MLSPQDCGRNAQDTAVWSTGIPEVEVDAITEGMVHAVITGTDTGENWWLPEPMVTVDLSGGKRLPGGALHLPSPWGAYSCPASTVARQLR